MNITEEMTIEIKEEMKKYLKYHKENIFEKEFCTEKL